ncbi:PLP-dependent aminotransferase family protein [Oscillatoria sp. FACHB-1407]|uniref:MocR-like pyridoxine biosynthesis transcription factor PdxR n=1 Tax=Oscillatoria sp. FACHB-1407 TaxID=2692847 RepID=UPI00168A1AC9|nr:PLP-dependent aminotransferase family protein [Oscillatoria sp. FACHB-1407]MBD2459583.1 PLP-dependent aminotransferase family protein [Oscillatoria sp. FACHB-1407]
MLWLSLDRNSDIPLIRQIYLGLRDKILTGELAAGDRLPATRELAAEWGVSRNVILEAYDQLTAEGYITGQQGSGTYVAEGAQWQPLQESFNPTNRSLPQPSPSTNPTDLIDFRSGVPALDHFPKKLWGQLSREVYAELPPTVMGYGTAEGSLELRSVLAAYLRKTRGLQCDAEQIVMTSGAAQAFALVAKLLLAPGDRVAIEDPIARELWDIYNSVEALLYPVPVGDRGIQPAFLPTDPPPKLTHVTPSHQFPLGSILSIQNRIELLKFAQQTSSFIVEDDYDSEFRYEGTPINSLQELDPERVIYVGTFSKILAPALRLGYLVLPPSLIQPCRWLKRLNDLHTPLFEQFTLARFIQLGHLERHINRMKKLYRDRRNTLRQALRDRFSTQVNILGDSTGLHLVAEFPDFQFSESRLHTIEQHRVRVYPVSIHAIAPEKHHHKIILGYSNLAPSQIELGIKRLQEALG